MRFQCLNVDCGRPFGWTAKKTITQKITDDALEITSYEYVVCPYCGSFDFEEGPTNSKPVGVKAVPPVQMPASVAMFDPADLMSHQWKKGKRQANGYYELGNLAYGWDFANKFKPETVRELSIQGTLEIGGYEFNIDQSQKFVRTKKAK